MSKESGIYKISFKSSNKVYIGSSPKYQETKERAFMCFEEEIPHK